MQDIDGPLLDALDNPKGFQTWMVAAIANSDLSHVREGAGRDEFLIKV